MKKLVFLIFIIPFTVFSQETTWSFLLKYKFAYSLNFDNNTSIDIGQISKDGKYYFLGITQDSVPYVNKYKISDTGSLILKDKIAVKMNGAADTFSGQVSLTDNELIMVFCAGKRDYWEENNLYIATRKSTDKPFEKVQIIKNVSTDDIAEAYPYLSSDGKRLYYTSNNKLNYAERNSTDDEFSVGQGIDEINDNIQNIISCWLNKDETEIYIVAENIIYRAKRKNINSKFKNVEVFYDGFEYKGFISAFCENEDFVFFYHSSFSDFDDSNSIIVLKKR